MTAKDKAIELYNKFRSANGVMAANGYAKKQAIICVDEIIKEFEYNSKHDKKNGYWQEVKKELEKM